jgi:hypothetical protein
VGWASVFSPQRPPLVTERLVLSEVLPIPLEIFYSQPTKRALL